MERLETKNLILRKAKESDLDAIYRNIWSDRDVAKTMMWKPTESREEAVERMKRTMAYHQQNHAYFVCLKENDEPIGFAGVTEEEPEVYAETGICVAAKCQGRGYGKEILGALLELSFIHLKGKRFIYAFMQHNERSKKVCLHYGFRYLESGVEVRQWDNQPQKVDYYGLDREEYLRRRNENETLRNADAGK